MFLRYTQFFMMFLLESGYLYASDTGHAINWWHLGPAYKDAPALGWLSISFMIFVYALVRAIKKPLSLYLETRSNDIRRAIEEGAKAKLDSEHKLKLYEEKLKTLDGEIIKLKSAFMEQAEAEKKEKERYISELEARIMRDTDDTIRSNFERTKHRLADEVIAMALKSAELSLLGKDRSQMDASLSASLIADLKTQSEDLSS